MRAGYSSGARSALSTYERLVDDGASSLCGISLFVRVLCGTSLFAAAAAAAAAAWRSLRVSSRACASSRPCASRSSRAPWRSSFKEAFASRKVRFADRASVSAPGAAALLNRTPRSHPTHLELSHTPTENYASRDAPLMDVGVELEMAVVARAFRGGHREEDARGAR